MKTSKAELDDYFVFDIETQAIPQIRNREDRLNAIRKLRVKCAYGYSRKERKYFYYGPGAIRKLVERLHRAHTIVGFNVLGFDYEVLAKHGLNTGVKSRTVDLMHLIREETGNWYSLDRLSKENFGYGKVCPENVGLRAYCKHDVALTRALYVFWANDELSFSRTRLESNKEAEDEDWPIEDHWKPDACPWCGSIDIEAVEDDFEGMTEGQLANRLAGFGAASSCRDCGHIIDHE